MFLVVAQSPNAKSAPAEPPASNYSVLDPATSARLNALSEEAKMRIGAMASRLGLSEVEALSGVGVVERGGGGDVTVAAIGGDVCAFLDGGIGGCDSAERVAAGSSFGVEPVGCDGYRVLSVVPDGITRIAIDSEADGDVDTTIPVESNVYVGVLAPVRTLVTGLDESGDPSFSAEIRLDSFASMNDGCNR